MSVELTDWERVALSRWGQYVTKVEHHAINMASSLAKLPGDAIEVGCEGGRWSKMLADQGWQMTCIDVNRDTLDVCQQKVPAANCRLVDPRDKTIPEPTAKFSLLLCIEVAPVIHSDWFLSEAARVLKPGGIMAAVAWNRRSLRGFISRRNTSKPDSPFYSESYAQWRARAVACGFQFQSERGFCWGPFSRRSDSPLVPLFVGVEKALRLDRFPFASPWVMAIATNRPNDRQ
ncbi:MAG TPA: class I SAM-dependent methyltransferase [Pyrinomonadaceae bacterium]|nr:class I SAM-dependent methyltransferase [Pyrinomonadaceae bacterium]